MSVITAQVSLYPLRQEDIGNSVRQVVRILRDHGLTVRIGEMSTLVWGQEQLVFAALQDAFHHATEQGEAVMTVTFSNACPLPETPQ